MGMFALGFFCGVAAMAGYILFRIHRQLRGEA
jgi:hypothetical protein